MPPPRLKILCLHGFTSNGAVHAHQLRRITQTLPEFDFEFPDGPHIVDMSSQGAQDSPEAQAWSDLVSSMSTSGSRAWWYARDVQGSNPGEFAGLERSMEYIGDLVERKGPFHAIWGFSQGACLAGMLCALLQEKQSAQTFRKWFPSNVQTPLAGVVFSGFKSRFPQYDAIYSNSIDIPMLHVIGENDTFVENERSETLASICSNPTFIRHAGGHNIPKDAEHHTQIVQFVRQHLQSPRSDFKQALI